MVTAAGRDRKVSAVWYLYACANRENMLVAWRVRAAPPEGDSSSLTPPLCLGAREGTLPLGKQHPSCTPARSVRVLSAELSEVLSGGIRTCKSLGFPISNIMHVLN